MKKIAFTVAGMAIAAGGITAMASSHREAPLIAQDPSVDNTDTYMFISPTDPSKLVIVANYYPLLIPASGPNFYKMADDARYEINIDNDGDAIPDITYRWTFDSAVKNGSTFLYNTGAVEALGSQNLNVVQSYRLDKIDLNTGKKTSVLEGQVAPWNVGKRSFPNNTYENVALQAIAFGHDGTK